MRACDDSFFAGLTLLVYALGDEEFPVGVEEPSSVQPDRAVSA
jgi:hypothetical protein